MTESLDKKILSLVRKGNNTIPMLLPLLLDYNIGVTEQKIRGAVWRLLDRNELWLITGTLRIPEYGDYFQRPERK